MGDILGRVAAIIFGCFILFIAPIVIIAQKQDAITQNYIDDAVVEFVDRARTTARISPFAYESLCYSVDCSGVLCEIHMYHTTSHMDIDIIEDYTPLEYPDAWEEPAGSGVYKDVVQITETNSTSSILDAMYPDPNPSKDYCMKQGDYLKVEVISRSPSLARKMLSMLFSKDTGTSFYSSYGGTVGSNIQ